MDTCFQLFVFINKATMGMHVQAFIGYIFSYILGKYKGVE